MTRNLKALGLALLAAFALAAIGAQVASAAEEHEFETTEGVEATVLTGTQEGLHEFTVGKSALACNVATFTGTTLGTSADTVEVIPHYTECFDTSELLSPTVDTNGCTYTFDSDTVETEGEEHAPIWITGCESEVGITITAGSCEIHVPEQGPLHGVSYTNLPNHGPGEKDAVTVTATVDGIEATSTGGFVCFLAGLGSGEKTHNDATYTGNTVMTGYIDEGTHTEWTEHKVKEGAQSDITVTGTP